MTPVRRQNDTLIIFKATNRQFDVSLWSKRPISSNQLKLKSEICLLFWVGMKKLSLSLFVFFLAAACSTVPVTGRKQVNLISSTEINALSLDQYQQVLRESQVVTGTPEAQMVQRVGQRIASATEAYLKQKGHRKLLDELNWEFNLIQSNQVNAWCMPGGKVAFYTGILPICQDDNGVAVVMGHEIAHALARHGNERMSQALLQQAGGLALNIALRDEPAQTRSLFIGAYGVASQVGAVLPFSRLHESEADEIGLILMAKAGYDPREAPGFWQRMAGVGNRPPEFLSTHPHPQTRMKDLNEQMEKAVKIYEKNKKGS
jgi:predicted Zn-dependent protease